METAFKNALFSDNIRVLKMDLEPLTVGHLFLLYQLESPVVTGRDMKFSSLIEAVFVCALPWRKAARGIQSWTMRPFFWLWGFGIRKLDFVSEMAKFSGYWKENMTVPAVEMKNPQAGQRDMGSPLPFQFLTILTSQFNKTHREAMDTTVTEANSLWACHGELEGRFNIRTERQNTFWEKCKAAEAAGFQPN